MLINSLTKTDLDDAYILFNHIPKTGGTSLIDLFKGVFGEDKCFRHRGRSARTGKTNPAIASLSDEELLSYRFIAGHFAFSAGDRLKKLGRKVFHITVVRDPVERLVSDYYFNQQQGRPDLREKALSMSIDAYAVEKLTDPESKMVNNGQCWFVCDSRSFAPAARNIDDKFLVACTNNQLDEMQGMLRSLLGLPPEPPLRSNTTKAKKASGLTPNIEALLRKSSEDDTKLVEFVRERFEAAARG